MSKKVRQRRICKCIGSNREENDKDRQCLSDRAEPKVVSNKEIDRKTEDTNKRLRAERKLLLKERRKIIETRTK
jgi:hypothetical protein